MFHGPDAILDTVICRMVAVIQPHVIVSISEKCNTDTLMAAELFESSAPCTVTTFSTMLCRLSDSIHSYHHVASVISLDDTFRFAFQYKYVDKRSFAFFPAISISSRFSYSISKDWSFYFQHSLAFPPYYTFSSFLFSCGVFVE